MFAGSSSGQYKKNTVIYLWRWQTGSQTPKGPAQALRLTFANPWQAAFHSLGGVAGVRRVGGGGGGKESIK